MFQSHCGPPWRIEELPDLLAYSDLLIYWGASRSIKLNAGGVLGAGSPNPVVDDESKS